jgi:hypothetical protein
MNNGTFGYMSKIVSNSVGSAVALLEDVGLHARDTGFGSPDVYDSLSTRLSEIITDGKLFVDLRDDEFDRDELVETYPDIHAVGLLYSAAIAAVAATVIEDTELVAIARGVIELSWASVQQNEEQLSADATELMNIIDEAFDAVESVKHTDFADEKAYCDRMVEQMEANGKGVCGHLRAGYITEPLLGDVFSQFLDDADPANPGEAISRAIEMIESFGGHVETVDTRRESFDA